MRKHLGKLIFIGIITGLYFLVSAIFTSNDFEDKSVKLMKTQGAKVISALDQFPGCAGAFTLKSTHLEKDWFFSKKGEGRSIYIDKNNNILDIKWSAELMSDENMILVQAKDQADLQARLMRLMLTSCKNM